MAKNAGTSSAQQGKKRKAIGKEWEFAYNTCGRYMEWQCNLCKVIKSGGAPRIRNHFLGNKCTDPGAPAIAKQLREELEKKGGKRYQVAQSISNAYNQQPELNINHDNPEITPTNTVEHPQADTVPSSVSSRRNTEIGPGQSRQRSLHQSFRTQTLEDAQNALAKAIFFTGSALVMVDNDHWKHAWKKIGEYGPGFSAPSYHTIRNALLDKCFYEVKERVSKIILGNISLSGCTIVSDGWSNVQRRPLINVMLVCPRGETFIKAVDSSGSIKSGSYIADVLITVIKEIGAEHVVQVVMDNAKNCKSAGSIIQKYFPHIYANGCSTHSLNLVLKDWYTSEETTWFAKIIDVARQVVKFILKRQRVLDVYRMRMSVMLKLPADTRFCTHYYTLESLLRNKCAVIDTFGCTAFDEWQREQSERVKEKITHLRESINKHAWWKSVMDAYHVMMPVMFAIRTLDERVPNLGKVWMTWWTVQQSLETPEELKESVVGREWRIPFSGRQRKVLSRYFHARWKSAHSPLHSVAYMLDPEYWNLDLMSNHEVVNDFYQVVNTSYSNVQDRINCIKEMSAFRLKEGPFANDFVQSMAKEQPAWKWWMMNGGEHYATLRPLAMKVLAQCAANSSSERNWSMYKYVHSTIRNRLLADRAEKLVYMFCNEKILHHIESDGYKEEMPSWAYDCLTEGEDDFNVGVPQCTIVEIEENLTADIDDSVDDNQQYLETDLNDDHINFV